MYFQWYFTNMNFLYTLTFSELPNQKITFMSTRFNLKMFDINQRLNYIGYWEQLTPGWLSQ